MGIILDVGERVRAIRLKNNMTQADLAEEAESCISHISDIENGKVEMGLDMFSRIMHALRISADELIPNDDFLTIVA